MRGEYIASERTYSDMMAVVMDSKSRQDKSTAFIHLDLPSKTFKEVGVSAAAYICANQRSDPPTVAAGIFFALRRSLMWRHPGQMMSSAKAETTGG